MEEDPEQEQALDLEDSILDDERWEEMVLEHLKPENQ